MKKGPMVGRIFMDLFVQPLSQEVLCSIGGTTSWLEFVGQANKTDTLPSGVTENQLGRAKDLRCRVRAKRRTSKLKFIVSTQGLTQASPSHITIMFSPVG